MEEAKGGQILRQHFPYGVLSDVPLFRADTPEEHLFANQVDHLLHLRRGNEEKLVIVECKKNVLRRWTKENSRPIVASSKRWFALYDGAAKDAKRQVRNQGRALFQNLDLQQRGGPSMIEGWVVHSGKHKGEIRHKYEDGVLLIAMTHNQFRLRLKRIKLQGWEAVPVFSSEFLFRLQLGRREDQFPHPVMIDALDHVRNSRLSLDGGIFTKLHRGQRRRHWAISGSAGSGKSVLLSYALCVFGTNYWIKNGPNGSFFRVLKPVGNQLPAAMPPLEKRRIHVFAMSVAQVNALKRYYVRFKEEFQSLNKGVAPAMAPIDFAQWTGEIPEDCTVLAIDEAQDLSQEDQAKIARWHGSQEDNYLAVALDHQQRLRQDRKKPRIILGLNFTGKTTTMTRSYRQTYPAAITGLALLFRWFSNHGPMIQPDKEKVPTNSEIATSLRGCLGANIYTDENTLECEVTMRNDSHPGNHWRRTVDLYERDHDIIQMLDNQRIDKGNVLWLRFNAAADSEGVQQSGVEFYDVTSGNLDTFIDSRIKGLEYPVVVIEGMPEGIDDIDSPENMWIARRQLYLCTSRAAGFLYFVLPNDQYTNGIREEISKILVELSDPKVHGHEIGETWKLNFKWRKENVIEVPDFADAIQDPKEAAEEAADEVRGEDPKLEEANAEDLEEIQTPDELEPEEEIEDPVIDENEDDDNEEPIVPLTS